MRAYFSEGLIISEGNVQGLYVEGILRLEKYGVFMNKVQ